MSFPLIPYTKAIPAAANNPSADQPDMQANTDAVDSILTRDHYPFNTNFSGLHKQSRYVAQAKPTTDPGILALYNKTGVSGSELYMARDNDAGTEVALSTSKFGSPVADTGGITFLAGPATGPRIGATVLTWGAVTGLSGSWPTTPQGVSFITAFANNCYNVQVTFIGPTSSSTGDICINSIISSGFTWQFTGNSSASFDGFYWQAIGN